jgi:hypothetical protein
LRRIKLVLAAVGVMAAITAASAVPAMANTNDHHVFTNDGFGNDGVRVFDNGNNGVFFNDGINNDGFFPFFGFPFGNSIFFDNGVNTFDHNGFGGINNIIDQEAE